MLKKDKIVNCGAPECTSRADKNSNIITLVTIIIMLLWQYRGIVRNLAYLMPAAYSKLSQISKMMRHIENSGIVRTVYSGIYRLIQGHPAIFSDHSTI